MTFSQIILTLQNYWQEQGCVILQPYDMPAGAGTYHQATFLRSLGPKPWATAYVAPSRRPTDGRYGENPNRLGAYYQFQVLIKPSPENIQELYLKSLERLGLNLWASSMMARAKFIAFTAITKAILMDITITLSAQDQATKVMKI